MRPPYPPEAAPHRSDRPEHPRPGPGRDRLGRFGLYLFLVSLTMFFAGGVVAYLLVRFRGAASGLEDASIRIPPTLWASTALLIVSAGTAHFAGRAARRDRTRSAHIAIIATFALGLLFVLVQIPALIGLLESHHNPGRSIPGLYGLAFTLVLLHALHVLAGMIPLAGLTLRTVRGHLTDHQHNRVRGLATYWHFLDVVWIALFATFLLTA
jgi:cytochrome c oxidase subunit 3